MRTKSQNRRGGFSRPNNLVANCNGVGGCWHRNRLERQLNDFEVSLWSTPSSQVFEVLHSQRCAGSNVNGFMPIHHFADMQPEPDATLLGWTLRLSQCVILCICQMSFKCCMDPIYWRSSLNGSKSTRQSRWSYQRHLRSGVHPAGFQYVLSSALTNKMRIRCERLICFPDILPGSPFPTGNSYGGDSGLADFGRLESKRARVFKHVHTNILLHPGTSHCSALQIYKSAAAHWCTSRCLQTEFNEFGIRTTYTHAWMLACPNVCTDRQTNRQAGRQTGRQASWQAGRPAGRQAGTQAGRQTDTHTDTYATIAMLIITHAYIQETVRMCVHMHL